MPVLGKRERDGTSESADGDTEIVTPADGSPPRSFLPRFFARIKRLVLILILFRLPQIFLNMASLLLAQLRYQTTLIEIHTQ